MNYVVATTKSWNVENFKALKKKAKANKWFLITDKNDLVLEKIKKINPRYIFFPHWSWIIPAGIYENFECVVFHMADLPYGRGGSPLQNLIVRGHKDTKISALRVVKELDAGPVYFKRNLSLNGSASEILTRCSKIVFFMIQKIIATEPKPVEQNGAVIEFKRRKPEEGDISSLEDLEKVYDYIRMLDAEGYPRAFLEKNNLRLEFEKAEFKENAVTSVIKIKIIKK
ncbi:methionyl-tRNA formyltransferase [Candidatus Peregrinibacteria bacterium]|nr:methionyl-tRNA formyltransferase [Candidatus Peregrinibacteria bacterium]